ncbi:GNAT family N-acetyltransferase [Streptomyces radicis]|uniref:GNAT family N-acetyltransferase n=1 Tax=Streptomyces radicis TaxID=1750517 RepID=A0A3A9WB27_9ACTN|nr:GNAT family N-acetyltransferase [Streptomyces radicis]RKN09573.1 GNAT family N-acetyltransferase [Streptomyces radicis]RKN23251.1 GNAT family N-acetyltransferase [Streptomyces radicis]
MSPDALTRRATAVWEECAGARVRFAEGAATVVTAPDSRFAPAGWAGIVTLGTATVATVPTEAHATALRRAVAALPTPALTGPEALAAVLPFTDVLGPATLAYAPEEAPRGHRGATGTEGVDQLPPDHYELRSLLAAAGPADAGESGLAEIISPAFTVREGGRAVAAAGYVRWPAATAHLCVLTAPDARGRGLARRAAAAAVAHARAARLLPQWRARPAASRRVAAALGFHELGHQLSVRLP